ncbi:YciI family protein [Streptomyces sp. NPDC050523]|uniref:YciI family protein n=1 Tax=Streptomyces sp. NPDC050523 TaxID=3365622 RepID=UPI0037A12A1E
MKYALLFCTPVGAEEQSPAEHADDPRFAAYLAEVRAGRVTGGARLRPAVDATTVRVRGDEVLLSDGPFAETKEYLAGISFIDVADLDEAIALAAKHPAAFDGGSVEVRPVWE